MEKAKFRISAIRESEFKLAQFFVHSMLAGIRSIFQYINKLHKSWLSATSAATRVVVSVKIRLAVFFCFLTVLLAAPVLAGSHSHPAKHDVPTDPGYVFALAAAGHFLHAWQTGDLENGMVLISDGIRHSQNADKLEEFFSSGTQRAFEVSRGHGHSGFYTFPVVLMTLHAAHITRKASEIVLIETGKNDWVVDKLP
jgi:hypothetical protein